METLEVRLTDVESEMLELIENSKIKKRFDGNSDILVMGPEYHWDFSDKSNRPLQLSIKKKFLSLREKIQLFFLNSPESIRDDLEEILTSISSSVEQEPSWDVPSSTAEAKEIFSSYINDLKNYLEPFKHSDLNKIVLVPDSNSLIIKPDFQDYTSIAKQQDFTIALVPTVLSELDKLKTIHRDNEFRGKVLSVINRIKGLRKQGSLLNGVKVYKTITVKMIATEPDFNNTLGWLDSGINDDRIIASSFELQRQYPSETVIIVTSDINLQNKAEMADLPYSEVAIT